MIVIQEYVRDWMTRDIITTTPTTPLGHARKLMIENNIRRLPVVGDEGLVGIITRNDIHEAEPAEMSSVSIWELHQLLSRLYVKGEMTPNPITVTPDDTIGHAANLMLKNKVGGLPVVAANGQLVGIITESDIFRLVVRELGE